jgi:hypothetical protein
MGSKEIIFLWQLINFCWLHRKSDESFKLASDLYNQPINLPVELESLVAEYAVTHKEFLIGKIGMICANYRYFQTEQHIVLISLLVENGLLTITSAIPLLNGINLNNVTQMSDAAKKVVDVVWLVKDDWKYGFMEPEDDNLLASSLKNLLQNKRNETI